MEKNFGVGGFTLLEILLSVAFIAAIATLSLATYENLPARNDLEIASASLKDMIYRAEELSSAVSEDSPWGVKIEDDKLILFKGNAYAARDANFDETTTMFNTTVSGQQEFIFSKVSGYPESTGATTLLSSPIGESKTISVNEKGVIVIE
jgi:Tfp pilus assembly protein FimT